MRPYANLVPQALLVVAMILAVALKWMAPDAPTPAPDTSDLPSTVALK